ncbi:MAG TPA: winged helix-turn-helix domain-containing protein [Verrucomicrobiae bacterium]|nr:winged helix-turn-helix domain-containing protein [Verrucomicrobiae bacterium]
MGRAVPVFRFGPYEVKADTQELHKHGTRLKLRGQPFLVLEILLEHAGEVVTRDQIRQKLWPSDTFVDFEHGLNTSIKKVRQVLCDSVSEPRYIETLPRIGYRFIAPVNTVIRENGAAVRDDSRKTTPPEGLEQPADKQSDLQGSAPNVRFNQSAIAMAPPAEPSAQPQWAVNWLLAASILAGVIVLSTAISIRGFLNVPGRWWHVFASTPRLYRSLAVLPLQSLSADPSQEYFTDGITDEIISDFAQSGDLRVISRTSTMRYKNTSKSAEQIGKELGVDALVEGSVERVGSRIRVRVELIDASNDRNLWARIYDRDLSDVLMLESSVANDVVEEARGRIGASAPHSPVLHAVNPQAYEAYLKGRYFWNKRSSEGLTKSIDLFQRAIALDPKLAVAYAGLANAYSILGSDVLPAQVAQARAREAAAKAIALDPSLAESHAAMALVAFYYDWDWPVAEREFQTALRLNPNYATAHQWYSYYLGAMRRFPEAMQEAQRARDLDPLSLSINSTLAGEYIGAEQYDQAATIDQRILEMDPNFVPAHLSLAMVYEGKKMWPQAIEELKKAVDLSQNSATPLAALAYGFALAGKRTEARRILDTLEELSAQKYVSSFEVAKTFVAINDYGNAFRYLERAYSEHESQIPFLNVTKALAPLQSDPRFHDLVKRAGLPAA